MELGHLVGLWRYPVKSMAAEPLTEADIGWHGIGGDRRWAFIRPGVQRSGFPWLTQRQNAGMGHFRPSFVDPARPDQSVTVVRTPEGVEHEVTDPALAARLGDDVSVIRQQTGIFDDMPLSLISTQTIDGVGRLTGRPLEPERFRPNLLVDCAGGDPFPEDGWLGCTLRIGGARIRVDRRDPRCVIVTIDPRSGTRDPTVLREISRAREGGAGVYGTVVTPGRVAIGDGVVLDIGDREPDVSEPRA